MPWSGLIMLAVMVLSFQASVQRVPFDISEAETELMEGPLMEYSGPKLALFKYAQMAKLVIYSALFVAAVRAVGSGTGFSAGLVAVLGQGGGVGAGGDAGRGDACAVPDRPGHSFFCGHVGGGAGSAGAGELWILKDAD